jgi:hypothetical protein
MTEGQRLPGLSVADRSERSSKDGLAVMGKHDCNATISPAAQKYRSCAFSSAIIRSSLALEDSGVYDPDSVT